MGEVAANRHNNRAGAEEVVANPHVSARRADIDSLNLASLESQGAKISADSLAADKGSANQGDRTPCQNFHRSGLRFRCGEHVPDMEKLLISFFQPEDSIRDRYHSQRSTT